jgi:MoxR-like ATPase
MFKVFVRYPSFEEERQIAKRTTSLQVDDVQKVLDANEILSLQKLVRQVPVTDHVVDYVLALVRQTRVGEPGVPPFVEDQLSWAKARALLNGRTYVSTDDIQALAAPVLRHRIVVNFSAESEGITSDKIVEQLIRSTPSKEGELTRDPNLAKIFAA